MSLPNRTKSREEPHKGKQAEANSKIFFLHYVRSVFPKTSPGRFSGSTSKHLMLPSTLNELFSDLQSVVFVG
jgi:hypothetical protein